MVKTERATHDHVYSKENFQLNYIYFSFSVLMNCYNLK